jgi:anti-sigma B factor antagonist
MMSQGRLTVRALEMQIVSLEHATAGADHILTVHGELDIYTAPSFTAALKSISGADRVIVDLRDCRYADGSAISALVRARKESAVPIRLVVRNGSIVSRILGLTEVDRLFAIFSSIEGAIG